MADLSLWLDSYNDIYSDFDNRNYNHRRVSEDFLEELRQELKYADDHSANLLLLLPAAARLEEQETLIISSLHDVFLTRFQHYRERSNKKLVQACFAGCTGIAVIILNAWLLYAAGNAFCATAIRLVMEPAGWFLTWLSLDWLVYDLADLNSKKAFYKKLSEIHLHFKNS